MTQTAVAAPVAAPTIDIATRVEQFVKLRDLIKTIEARHKEELKQPKETLQKLSDLLLNHLNTINADNVSSSSGTVYRTERKSASIADGEAFMKYVIANNAWDLLDRKANPTSVEDFINQHAVAPPGVTFNRAMTVGVRRK